MCGPRAPRSVRPRAPGRLSRHRPARPHEQEGPAIEEFVGDEERAISVIAVSELLHGVHRAKGARRTRRLAFVEHLLATLEPIPITEPVARVHAEVWAELAAHGKVIGSHDLWIAATTLAHGFGVATGNSRDFERVPGSRVLGFAI